MTLLLSVIIPTFQRGRLIEHNLQAYLAALHQGAQAVGATFECLVIDDGSPDDSIARLQQRFGATPGLRIVQMPVNAGPGPARDAGVALAQGDWIWFLDDDDVLDANHVATLLAALLAAPPDVAMVSHSQKQPYPQDPARARRELAQRVMAYREFQEVFRHVVRRDLLERHAIRFSSGWHEDIRYIVELLLRSPGVQVLPQTIVLKQKTDDAITARMSTRRIDGYLQAYNECCTLLEGTEFGTPRLLQQMLAQTLGVVLLLVTRESDEAQALAYLDHLRVHSIGTDTAWARDLARLPSFGPLATNFEYVGAVWRARAATPDAALLAALREVFRTRLSCKDLDSSLFLGPDEIRACCKRFFVHGIRKGDVVLLKADAQIDLPRIHAAKQELIDRINADNAPECSGCPYIERRPVQQGGIDYLSLENFAYCNMRCTYCSPKYYGGTEAQYNAATIVEQLAKKAGGFEANCHVVWGGGEPTLSPRFDSVNRSLAAMPQSGKIRVLSNSLKYSGNLEVQLNDPRFHLVTSIDAGTEETFRALRGKPGLQDVLDNLLRYQQVLDDRRRLTIKYIVGAHNHTSSELVAYVARLAGSPLLDSLFQVSCDFTLDAPEDDLVCALYELALRLLTQGARFVFFDDLVRDRVHMTPARAKRVQQHLATHGIDTQHLWTPESATPLVLWGAGKQAQWLTQHTLCGQSGCIRATVSDEAGYRQWEVQLGPVGILPAGVQNLYEIFRNIERAGLGTRLARGVLL